MSTLLKIFSGGEKFGSFVQPIFEKRGECRAVHICCSIGETALLIGNRNRSACEKTFSPDRAGPFFIRKRCEQQAQRGIFAAGRQIDVEKFVLFSSFRGKGDDTANCRVPEQFAGRTAKHFDGLDRFYGDAAPVYPSAERVIKRKPIERDGGTACARTTSTSKGNSLRSRICGPAPGPAKQRKPRDLSQFVVDRRSGIGAQFLALYDENALRCVAKPGPGSCNSNLFGNGRWCKYDLDRVCADGCYAVSETYRRNFYPVG